MTVCGETVCGDCINCKESIDGGFNHYVCKKICGIVVELDTPSCNDYYQGY